MLGLLGLAIVGFAADRLLQGDAAIQPNSAAAESPPAGVAPPVPGPAAPAPAMADEAKATSGSMSVADRLKTLADPEDLEPQSLREAFAPPLDWLRELQTRPGTTTAPEVDPVAEFAAKHKVTVVMLAGSAGSAIIDGKIMQVGQELDGFTLVRMAAGSVVFRAKNGAAEVELRLTTEPR